jgi:hypothetical protein
MLAQVIDRLKQQATFLNGRVEGAADLVNLLETRKLSTYSATAHVIPFALRGGAADVATGLYRQQFDEAFSIILSIRSNDANGKAILDDLRTHIMSIVTAIAGWAPTDEVGVFSLVNGRVLQMGQGAFIYEINFSIQDQLRITT